MTSLHDLPVPPISSGGAMGQLVRESDWSESALGEASAWSQSLRFALALVLNTQGAAALFWGSTQLLLYNDAYGDVVGEQHPWAFGQPMAVALPDLTAVLGPHVAQVLSTGEGRAIEDLSRPGSGASCVDSCQ